MQAGRRIVLIGLPCMAAGSAACAAPRRTAVEHVPAGYVAVGVEQGVPPKVLFGVALQESHMMFGERGNRRRLPWPWTLNIAGTPARFNTRLEAERALASALLHGIDSVDIGAMQVNWRFNRKRLLTQSQALEPYWNLRVGASILRDNFQACNDWFTAVGRYHSPGNVARATQYASSVYARLPGLVHG